MLLSLLSRSFVPFPFPFLLSFPFPFPFPSPSHTPFPVSFFYFMIYRICTSNLQNSPGGVGALDGADDALSASNVWV